MRSTCLADYIKEFFPNLSGGICYGNTCMAIPALILDDLITYIKRLNTIYHGPVNPNDPKKRIRLPDVVDFIKQHHLDIDIPEIKETKDAGNASAELKAAWKNLEEKIKATPIYLPSDLKALFTCPEESLGELLDLTIQDPKELKAISELSWKINERIKRTNSYSSFISELQEIDTFFSNIALFHDPKKFQFLFNKTNRIDNQYDSEKVKKLIGNYNAIAEVTSSRITHLYSFSRMQSFFNNLARAIKDYRLPIAFSMQAFSHIITVSFDYKTNRWILISNEPYPQSISQEKIALEVFKKLKECIVMKYNNFNLIMKYSFVKKELFIIDIIQTNTSNPNTIAFDEDEKAVLSYMHANKHSMRKITDVDYVIQLRFYTHRNHLVEAQKMLHDWQQSSEFKEDHQMLPGMETREDYFFNNTILEMALRFDDVAKLQRMINEGLQVNRSFGNIIPLDCAVYQNVPGVVKFLLANNADPKLAHPNGWTYLHTAANHGFERVAELLLEAKAPVNAFMKDSDQTPLYTAIHFGNANLVDLLLQKGAAVDCARPIVNTELFSSANRLDFRYALKTEKLVDLAYQQGTFLLLIAAKKGYRDVMDVLIAQGVEVNLALLFAVDLGMTNETRILLKEKKADPNYKVDGIDLPLKIARDRGFAEIERLLIEAGAVLKESPIIYLSRFKFFAMATNDSMPEMNGLFFVCNKM